MKSFAGTCAVLFVLTLVPSNGLADEVAICRVVAVDEAGLVTAEETATGATFEFKPPRAALRSLTVGAPLEADLDARVVLLGEQKVPMRKLRRGNAPPRSSEEPASSETETPPRSVVEPRAPGSAEIAPAPETTPPSVTETNPEPAVKAGRPVRRKSGQTKTTTGERAPSGKPITATATATSPSIQRRADPRPKRQPGGGSTPPSEPLPCYATGCSGQICEDRDVNTTCNFRPEYACYRTAQCKRQADGNCGWTKTAELEACLQNPPPP